MVVKFFAYLRNITKAKEIEITGPQNVLELLFFLSSRYGKELKKHILTDKNEIHPDIIILVNGRHIDHLQWGETRIDHSDEISFFPRIAGG